MRMTGGEALAKQLQREGVRVVFGLPGVQLSKNSFHGQRPFPIGRLGRCRLLTVDVSRIAFRLGGLSRRFLGRGLTVLLYHRNRIRRTFLKIKSSLQIDGDFLDAVSFELGDVLRVRNQTLMKKEGCAVPGLVQPHDKHAGFQSIN